MPARDAATEAAPLLNVPFGYVTVTASVVVESTGNAVSVSRERNPLRSIVQTPESAAVTSRMSGRLRSEPVTASIKTTASVGGEPVADFTVP